MNLASERPLAVALVSGAALLFLLVPGASSQIRANPSYLPIGASSSGNASTVWFHEPSTGRALACQTVVTAGSGLTGIQCVATKLPQPDSPP
jgi:hypothetical protein